MVWTASGAGGSRENLFYRRDDKGKIKQQTSKKNGIFNSV
jgi:hypothetical protein